MPAWIQKYVGWIGLVVCMLSIFLYVFGAKVLHLDSYMFASSYDVIKNYFTFYYYIDIQEGQLLDFMGMNYPYGDHVLYADNTPILAMLLKTLGITKYPVGLFNGFILLNYVLGPVLAFALSRKLKFRPIVGIIFALFVTWVNPQIFNSTSASNLSLSWIFIAATYLLVCIHQENKASKYYYLIFCLLFLTSFIHLYYLILLAFIFLPAGFIQFFKDSKKGIKIWVSTLFGGIAAYGLILLTDQNFSNRPKGSLGFNYHLWRANISSYFESYDFLSFPTIFQQKSQNIEWFGFIGSAYPIIILIAIIFLIKKRNNITRKRVGQSIMFVLLFVLLVSFFTSIGNHIYFGESRTFNFLNPLHLISHVTDMFNNFRFLSRFKFIVFVMSSALMFYVINKVWTEKYFKIAGIIALIICCIDMAQMAQFAKRGLLNNDSIFSIEHPQFTNIPEFDINRFDAILPIPYFHVGSETQGYIIDDHDQWSQKMFQLSLKNRLPLLATKLSRTPLHLTKQHFSLFLNETNQELLKELNGKRILIAWTDQYKEPIMGKEPAKTISTDLNLFIDKWNPTFLYEKDHIRYYELVF